MKRREPPGSVRSKPILHFGCAAPSEGGPARTTVGPGTETPIASMREDHRFATPPEDGDMADSDMAWARLDPTYVPPEIDTTVPSVARVYDAILGGKDNFAVDRAVADEAMRTMADGGNGARLNRAALGRAVRYMADRGVSQFLDLGSGLPAAQNTHQIAQAANPEARVVYVDNDPSVSLHGQALLTGDDSTVVVLADVRSPDELLALPAVAGFLDFSRPIGLILNAVIHHLLNEEDPHGIVARYLEALAPGSFMQLTHFCDESAEARSGAGRRSWASSTASTWSRRAWSSCPTGARTSRSRTRRPRAAC